MKMKQPKFKGEEDEEMKNNNTKKRAKNNVMMLLLWLSLVFCLNNIHGAFTFAFDCAKNIISTNATLHQSRLNVGTQAQQTQTQQTLF